MSTPITEPGWYRAGPKGLERVADPGDDPDDKWNLVKVELDEQLIQEPLW